MMPTPFLGALPSDSIAPAPARLVDRPAVASSSFEDTTGLSIAPSPDVDRSRLGAVAAVAPDDIWAVGAAGSGTLAEHFDGTSWSVVPTADLGQGTFAALNGVAAVASDDVWAVGSSTGGTLIEHFDGTSWSVVPSPTLPRGGVLSGVTAVASDDVWAVGNVNTGSGFGNLIEHWDGTSWSVVPVPSFTSRDLLRSVSATSSTDVWAVGQSGRHPGVEILHFDGQSWSAVATPSPVSGGLNGVVALASDDVWAVGSGGPDGTLIEHFDGTSWSVVPSPNVGGPSLFAITSLSGVAAVAPDDIWAVGTFADPNTGFERTLTEHWDGTSWSVIASPNATTGHDSLSGVAALSDGTVVAVGTAGENPSDGTNINGLILQK